MIKKDTDFQPDAKKSLWLGDLSFCVSNGDWEVIRNFGIKSPTVLNICGHKVLCWPMPKDTYALCKHCRPHDVIPMDSEILCLAPAEFVPANAKEDGCILPPQEGTIQALPLFRWGEFELVFTE
jgi:hypothetical protein